MYKDRNDIKEVKSLKSGDEFYWNDEIYKLIEKKGTNLHVIKYGENKVTALKNMHDDRPLYVPE